VSCMQGAVRSDYLGADARVRKSDQQQKETKINQSEESL